MEALLSDPSLGWTTAPEPEEQPLGVFGTDESLPSPDPDPAPRTGGGAKASERILALLNGQTPGDFASMDFSAPLPETKSAPEPDTAERPAPPAAAIESRFATSRFADPMRDLLIVIRKPKVALVIGGVLVVVLIVALLSGGGEHPADNQTVFATAAPSPAAAGQPTTTTAVSASAIEVKSAQSHCPPGGTPGMDAFAGAGKAWSCTRAYKVDGQVLTIDLGRSYQIESIGITPGWDAVGSDGVDQWPKYRTASRVSYQFDDANATTYTQKTMDQRALVVTKVNPPVSASRIVVTVLASKGDPSINTIALSSIVITGH
ncbi:discoidin domain-containing protein [Nocardia sp. NBC_01327]|uniref:discoidin domain-containing protein n=1 Tax=Nocardia sp. NBC_01327 TaxID=2903593 RepID=UPI002E15CC91|nr:discoidin domain-containing protein [Nocardia sp. NBC_01327]